MSTPIAIYLPSRNVVKVRKGDWSTDIPADELRHWIDFQRDMCERRNGKYREHYEPMLEQLLKAQAKIEEKGAA